MTDTDVKINGQSAGSIHQGGFCEFEYDVTSLIKTGKRNRLEVTVSKESANASVNSAERKADWWLFGGIYRPVYLKALPQVHIERIAVDARMDGSLLTELYTEGLEVGTTLKMDLVEAPSLMNQGKSTGKVQSQTLKLKSDNKQVLNTQWQGVKSWNPE